MITEIRMIAFSNEALVEAVRLFGQSNSDRHFSTVAEVIVEPGTPPTVFAEVCGAGTDATDNIEFTPAETAAFLILLCRRQRIPLPYQADKSLRMVGGDLCLVLTNRSYSSTAPAEPALADADGADGADGSEADMLDGG